MKSLAELVKGYPSLSRVFITHPRTACVVSIIIALVGAFGLSRLAVAEYPNITPVTITVSANYTGASAKVLSDSVGQVLEDQINSVEDIWYYKSNCNDKGLYNCYCTFRPGVPSNIALVNVQNAVKRAEPKLPAEVTQSGITVKKRPEDRMVMYMFMTDGREMDILDLSNFVEKQVADSISRMDGVALVESGGRTYSMRIWLDPVKLAGLNISIPEIKSAIESQNVQAAAGTIGGEYANRHLTFKLNVKGRLTTKEEFEDIVVRSNPATGAQVKIRDIARVELGARGYTTRYRFDEQPAVSLSVYKTPEANAVATAARVKVAVDEWIKRMPAGVVGVLADDTTAFTKVFLTETFWTLIVALILVVAITYLFLQDWRATFVPAIAIPISLLGTFAFLYPLGYTLNVLTMFGLILVIGSLVDDAIVVVENTQSLMQREGLSAKEAAAKSMTQITGAVIATTLVTLACYLPLAFYGGMVGMMYVQFAVTMCIALCLSTVVAIVLSPVLCAYLLRAPDPNRKRLLLAPFNWTLDKSRTGYLKFVGFFVRRGFLTVLLFAGCAVALWFVAGKVPSTFLPKEDRGYIGMNVRLSEGQSMERTIALVDAVHERAAAIPGVQSVSSTCGNSGMWGSGENLANVWFRLEHWDKRKAPELAIDRIMDRLKESVADLHAGEFVFTQPAAVRGLGGSSGVGFNFCALEGATPQELLEAADNLIGTLRTNELVKSAVHGFTATTPQLSQPGARPAQGGAPGPLAEGRLRDPAESARVVLRQRLQSEGRRLRGETSERSRSTRVDGGHPRRAYSLAERRLGADLVDRVRRIRGRHARNDELQQDARRLVRRDAQGGRCVVRRDETHRVASAAEGLRRRMGPRAVAGKGERGTALLAHVRRLALRVSLPRRPVRKLDGARFGDALRVVRADGGVSRLVAHENGALGLCPARLRDADRPRGEERDFDGRVFETGARSRVFDRRGGDARRGSPLPRGHDDGVELHHRRPAARLRERRGRGRDEGDRHLHVRGYARGDLRRHRFRSGALRPLPASPRTPRKKMNLAPCAVGGDMVYFSPIERSGVAQW